MYKYLNMVQAFKPEGYNSVSPYFVVDEAQKFLDLLVLIFDATPLRRYEGPHDSIMHAELKIDDSIIMLGNSSEKYPANKLLVHIYLQDVDQAFARATQAGCVAIQEPTERPNDPDRRGSFMDFAGNTWAIATQLNKI